MNDNSIIELFLQRNEAAIAELDKKYGKACRNLAENIIGNRQDAEECVSDSFLRVWNSVPPEHPSSLMAYTMRITRNSAISRYRYNTAAQRDNSASVPLDELEDCLSEAEGDAKEISEALYAFLDKLDKNSRIMFVRRYWYSDSIETLSKATGMSEMSVYQKLFQIRKKLKAYLIKEGFGL